MNNDQFDELTRTIANGVSRREALKLLFAGLFGLFINPILKVNADQVEASEDLDTSRFISTSTLSCIGVICKKGTNDFGEDLTCEQANQYVQCCGVYSEVDKKHHPGSLGITLSIYGSLEVGGPSMNFGKLFKSKNVKDRTCLTVTTNWTWLFNTIPTTNRINYSPSQEVCCTEPCLTYVRVLHGLLDAHEKWHVNNMNTTLKAMNEEWRNRTFTACTANKGKRKELENELKAVLTAQVLEAAVISEAALTANMKKEPPGGNISDYDFCLKCKQGTVCCAGTCCRPDTICQNGICKAACGDGFCRENYDCAGSYCAYGSCDHPVCCSSIDCVCPSGYFPCPGTGLCFKDGSTCP